MKADFFDANARHHLDADFLFDNQRWANADHLYGLSRAPSYQKQPSVSSIRIPQPNPSRRCLGTASEIRVAELAEDYPWVTGVLAALTGLNVPCAYADLLTRWQETFPKGTLSIHTERLPAQHADRWWDGIRDDLQRLGLVETKKDGRIDMPDLYRVGFRLGRKGGVAPKG